MILDGLFFTPGITRYFPSLLLSILALTFTPCEFKNDVALLPSSLFGNDDKNSQQNDQKADEKKSKEEQELSIESGVPDLENLEGDSGSDGKEIEIEDSSQSTDKKKDSLNNYGDKKYKAFTDMFDEIVNAEDLESEEELNRLRENLDQYFTL